MSKLTALLDLKAGERFLLDNILYIRTNTLTSEVKSGAPLHVNCVAFYSGSLELFNTQTRVYKVA